MPRHTPGFVTVASHGTFKAFKLYPLPTLSAPGELTGIGLLIAGLGRKQEPS